jgi:hypothetical protein
MGGYTGDHMTRARYLFTVLIISLMLLIMGCACNDGTGNGTLPPDDITQITKQQSQEIAEEFIINSPTFAYDGIAESLELERTFTARCPACWVFIFKFECSSAGYGDRTGQQVAQVITPHTATITVQQGEITTAELDEKWDMLKQKLFE